MRSVLFRLTLIALLTISFMPSWAGAVFPVPGAPLRPLQFIDAAGRSVQLEALPRCIIVIGRGPHIILHLLYMFPEGPERLAGMEKRGKSASDFLDLIDPAFKDKKGLGVSPGPEAIAALRARSVSALSGGERQLVILARALVQDPRILLLDEPMSHLDIGNTRRILQVMAGLKKNGKTIVFTTHDPNIAAAADDVVLLRAGRLLAFGPTASTLNAENLSAMYGVRVDVVILDGRPVILTRA
jgi:hypothetical protein